MDNKINRLEKANDLIKTIASCGRKFFYDRGIIGELFIMRGRVYYRDSYSQHNILINKRPSWNGFSGGGTCQSLIKQLKDFILTGKTIPLSITLGWGPDWIQDADPWGYGFDKYQVRITAYKLGICTNEKCKEIV